MFRGSLVFVLLSLLQHSVSFAAITRLPLIRNVQSIPLVPRRLRGAVPLGGNFPRDGEYFVNVTIGGQPISLLIDTGSSDVGVAAVGCNGCAHKLHRWYDPSTSPNATAIGCDWCTAHQGNGTASSCKTRPDVPAKQCTFRVSYEDTTGFSAALWEDSFAIGDMPATRTVVGAMYEASFPNPKSVDGIIGLADVGESDSGAPTPIDDLVTSGAIDNVFALCLQQDGGQMYLGEQGDELIAKVVNTSASEMRWTPRLASSAFYAIEVVDVTVAGVSIGVAPSVFNTGDAIVDSGTSDVCFPASAFTALKAHFASLCHTQCLKGVCDCQNKKPLESPIFENRCVAMTAEERAEFPEIEVEFGGGLKVPYAASSYLRSGDAVNCDSNSYTIAISRGGPDGSGTIFGDTFMMGWNVVHDRRPPQRIGFARVGPECP